MGAPMRLLNLSGWSIKRMLRLEEALLRHEGGNWCLVNALPAGSKTHPTTCPEGKASSLLTAIRRGLADTAADTEQRMEGQRDEL